MHDTKNENNVGYIYIMTNPAFPQYVKIGYAKDPEKRLKELNSSSAVPLKFHIYATYQVDSDLSDKKVHSIIDKLNPELRSIDGNRVREFYVMTAEDAYSILEAIAVINGMENRLKKVVETKEAVAEDQMAKEADDFYHKKKKRGPFSFEVCGIKAGELVYFVDDDKTGYPVCDDLKHILFKEKETSLSIAAKELLGWKWAPQGPAYFKYNGQLLDELMKKSNK